MSAKDVEYAKMFGTICDEAVVMARCACVACNSCTCACSCRNIPDLGELDWEQYHIVKGDTVFIIKLIQTCMTVKSTLLKFGMIAIADVEK